MIKTKTEGIQIQIAYNHQAKQIEVEVYDDVVSRIAPMSTVYLTKDQAKQLIEDISFFIK
jgi:hypothetical protein